MVDVADVEVVADNKFAGLADNYKLYSAVDTKVSLVVVPLGNVSIPYIMAAFQLRYNVLV